MKPFPDASTLGLLVTWTPVPEAVACQVTIEDEEAGDAFSMTLGEGWHGLPVPDGFLEPETERQLAIATVAGKKNASFVEYGFLTAERD